MKLYNDKVCDVDDEEIMCEFYFMEAKINEEDWSTGVECIGDSTCVFIEFQQDQDCITFKRIFPHWKSINDIEERKKEKWYTKILLRMGF